MAPSKGLFTYETLAHATAGAVGSSVAMATFYPLDTVRSRLQLDDKMKSKNTFVLLAELASQEGFQSLYRGMVPVLQSLCASNFVYFYTFHGLKSGYSSLPPSALRDLFLGCVAGIINVFTTTPLWVVNTRLKMQGVQLYKVERDGNMSHHIKYRGLIDGLRYTAQYEGIAGLWSGTLASLVLVINPAIQFMLYEFVKRHLQAAYGRNVGIHAYFLAGAFSKAVATVLTYPIQLVQTKQRHGHNFPGLSKNVGMIKMTMYILRNFGVAGLFKGLEAKVLQTVLTAALMFMAYEKIASFILRMMLAKSTGVAKA